jgi:hypothetical protein
MIFPFEDHRSEAMRAFDEMIQEDWDRWHRAKMDELKRVISECLNKGKEMPGVISQRRPIKPIAKSQRGRYQTRSGLPVTILEANYKGRNNDSVVGITHKGDHDIVQLWKADGSYYGDRDSDHDLFETVEAGSRTKYITYYDAPERLGSVYNSESDAKAGGKSNAIVLPIQIPAPEQIVIVA